MLYINSTNKTKNLSKNIELEHPTDNDSINKYM